MRRILPTRGEAKNFKNHENSNGYDLGTQCNMSFLESLYSKAFDCFDPHLDIVGVTGSSPVTSIFYKA